MDPTAHIHNYLAELRRRLQVLVLVRDSGIFLSLCSLLALVLLLLASALEPEHSLRMPTFGVGLCLSVSFALHLTLRLRRLKADMRLAALVGRACPALQSDLLSTVELDLQQQQGKFPFSQALFDALARQTWHHVRCLKITALVSSTKLRPAALLLTGAALAWAAAAASLPQQIHRGAARLLLESRRGEGEVSPIVVVGDLRLRYSYPPYTGRAPRTVAGSTGRMTAPKGTRVELSARALAPVSEAALLLRQRGQKDQRLPLGIGNGGELGGTLSIAGDGSYHFEVLLASGKTVLDPIVHRIQVEPDSAPRVILYGPPAGRAVTMRHHVEIGYNVEDDYGLIRIDLVYQVGSNPLGRTTLWRPKGDSRPRVAMSKHAWDLATIDLHPDEQVAYWIEALDNDAVSGPKLGRSSTLYLKVYSAAEKHNETIRQQERLVEQAIRILADRLLLDEEPPPPNPQQRLGQQIAINRAHESLVDGLRELRNRMRQDTLISQAVLRAVSRLQQQMAHELQTEGTLLRSVEGARRRYQVRPAQLSPLREHNRKFVAEMEAHVLLLANLLDEQRLQSLVTMSHDLREARKRLAELLQRYRQTNSEELRWQVLRQIEQMKQQVDRLMAKLSQLGSALPDEYLNTEALQELDLAGSLSKLARQVQSGQTDQLEAALAALEQKLDQLGSLLNSDLQQFREGRMSGREQAFAEALERLQTTERAQRELAQRTQRVIHSYQQRAARLMRNRITPILRQELARLAQLRRSLNEIDAAALPGYDQEQLERIKQRAQDLQGRLEQGDLDQALRMALHTRNGLEVLQDDLIEEMEGLYAAKRAQLGHALGHTRAARTRANELMAALKGIFPEPRELLDRGDQQQLEQLRRQQHALGRRVQELSSWIEQQTKQSALFGGELAAGLKEAAGIMGKAEDKLAGSQPQEAHSSQEAAAEQLAQLRKGVEQAREPRQWSQAGPSLLRERIHIPGADAFRPPKEFREDILEAMKEKPPRAYRRQVKRYYEELVR